MPGTDRTARTPDADDNPSAGVLVRALAFSTGARWHGSQPTPASQAGGIAAGLNVPIPTPAARSATAADVW